MQCQADRPADDAERAFRAAGDKALGLIASAVSAQAFLTNSDLSFIGPMPSILQSIS